jgi:hypothetical protein
MKRRIYLPFLIGAGAVLVVLGASVLKGDTGALGMTVLKGDKGGGSVTVPEAWRGTWEVTVTYSDRETGRLVATDVTTGPICPGEPVMPAFLDTSLHFSGEALQNKLWLSTQAKQSPRPGCNVFVEATFNSWFNRDIWSGKGGWKAKVVGNCPHLNFAQDVVVSGKRISREAACDGEQSSLGQRFFAHSALIPFIPERTTP